MDILDDELKFRHLNSGTLYGYIRIIIKKRAKTLYRLELL